MSEFCDPPPSYYEPDPEPCEECGGTMSHSRRCSELQARLEREADAEAAFWAPGGTGSVLLGFPDDEENSDGL